ncbi:MAG: DUF4340 domain-containing protein [Clostridiales bacterium]|nr:DUF4340 domain-containing protein [Clostridiales bacterium]
MKSLKKLLIPLIVMVLLIVALIVFVIIKNNKPGGEEEFNTDVLTLHVSEVSNLTIHRSNNDEDIVMDVVNDGNGNISYVYNGVAVDDQNYSVSSVSNFISVLCSYNVNSLVKNSGALSEYGLDDPESTIIITTAAGQQYRILLGDDTYEGANCYMKIDGDDNIYTVAVAKKLYTNYSDIDFLKSQILNIDYAHIASIQFDRSTDDIHLKATCEVYEDTGEPQFFIYEPYKIQASAYFENLMKTICTLEIAKFIDVPSGEESSYGLDDPAFHILISMDNGQRTELYISRKLAGYYYGRLNGMSECFMLSDMQITGLETPLLTLIDSYIAYYTSSEVSSVSGSYGDESFRLEIRMAPSGKYSDPESSVKLDNRNAVIYNSEGRIYASVLYESLATITIGGIDLEAEPSIDDSIMTLTFVTTDYKTIKIDFVPRNDSSYYVMMDDSYSCFYVSSDELFRDGGLDTYNYGVWPAYHLLDTAIRENINGVYDIPQQ